jgi:hypothetical protein
MIRGILVFLMMWMMVSGTIWLWFKVAPRQVKISILKATAFGAVTAVLATVVVLAMVYLF